MRYKITIEYDGLNYCGWQKQKNNKNSIQESIENAIKSITNEKVEVYGCGRTDAKVHALCQEASFVLTVDITPYKLKRAINLCKELNINLWVIGDGPDRDMYYEYVKDNKLQDKVSFYGRQQNPYPYMKEADYIILTSDYEGFPVVYQEAIALNKPIITTINTSDDQLDMKDYAYIVSKDEKKMVSEVKVILNKNEKQKLIDLEKIQKQRIKEFEKLFNS